MIPLFCILQVLLLVATWPLAILALCGVFDRIATPEAVRALWLDLPLWMGGLWAWVYISIVRSEVRRRGNRFGRASAGARN